MTHEKRLRTTSCIVGASALCLTLAGLASPSPAQAQANASAYTYGYRYDAQRRLVGTISPDPDGEEKIKYAATRSTYDVAGRLIRQEIGELATWQPEGVAPLAWTGFTIFQTVETTYDAAGRPSKESVSAAGVLHGVKQYSYDNVGRSDCIATRMNPNAYGNLPVGGACEQGAPGDDGPDRISKHTYYPDGKLKLIQDGYGAPGLQRDYATYTYSPNGRRKSVKDARGNLTSMAYDGHDRLTQLTFPSKTAAGTASTNDFEQYGYDANNNRTSLTKRNGQVITYSYDALNRTTVKDLPSGADVYYGYDLRGLPLYARFGSDAGQGITNDYDGAGRLRSTSNNVGGVARALSYEYDANGNRTRLTFPNESYFTYVYDGLDRMTEVKESGSTNIVSLVYNNRGARESLSAGGLTTYAFDSVGRPSSLEHNFADSYWDLKFSFTRYNPANQLISQTTSNSAYLWTESDGLSRAYEVNGLNQYTAVGDQAFCYDANGNLTSDGVSNYEYDVENRLLRARTLTSTACPTVHDGAVSAELSYDPMGRLFQTVGEVTTRFLYDGNALVAEYDGSGALLQRYVHGPGIDEPIVWYEGAGNGGRKVLHADQRGSVIAVTNASGVVGSTNAYNDYGIPASRNQGRFAYTGQIRVPELGMYYYKARIYSPTLGRFLQTDPVGYEDGLNWYAYVGNDPINKTDPSGEFAFLIVPVIGGLISGGLEAHSQYQKYGEIRHPWAVVGHTGAGVVSSFAGAGAGNVAGRAVIAAVGAGRQGLRHAAAASAVTSGAVTGGAQETLEQLGEGKLDGGEIAKSTGSGAIMGGLAKVAGTAVDAKAAQKTVTGVVEWQATRAPVLAATAEQAVENAPNVISELCSGAVVIESVGNKKLC